MSSIINGAKVTAIIQARMGSTRLPGKTLIDICGKPLLAHVIERVQASHTIDEILVATTTAPEDLAIQQTASQYALVTYAGSSDDVLDRFYQAAKGIAASIIVRITADDPFKDPEVLDHIVECFLASPDLDYASNSIEPSYPEGLDIEVFKFSALERAWKEARLPSEREHVTPYIWKYPDRFNVASVKNDTDLSHLRWTLDYVEDLHFAREVYAALGGRGIFLMRDILALLEANPALTTINQGIARNAGYTISLEKDEAKQLEGRVRNG